jgi:hypothetical protein
MSQEYRFIAKMNLGDNISASTPLLQGGQDLVLKVCTYAVVFEHLFRFSALVSTGLFISHGVRPNSCLIVENRDSCC